MRRISSVDFVRGLVMIIMALDHIRDLFHVGGDPTNLATTTPFLFFTRWVTHLCAPTFVFLSGVSAYLSYKSQSLDMKSARQFVRKRGLWLIILEFTVVGFGIWFDIKFRMFFFQVIATIGFGFVILSFLMQLRARVILYIGLVIIFLHNLLGLLPFGEPPFSYLQPLFAFSFFQLSDTTVFAIGYPPIPWLGIMLAGYGFGELVFDKPMQERKSALLKWGIGALLVFIVLRLSNIYGDPVPWISQKDGVFTFLSFMNLTKYPPSLTYTLATLGISFLLLSLSDGVKNSLTDIVSTYGKVPLFYYIIHWYVIHIAMFAMLFVQGFGIDDFVFGPFELGRPKEPSGIELGWVYLVWILIVAAMYPLCKWYANYKATHRENQWLRYL